MSGIIIQPEKLCGTLPAPPSKSVAHRAIIAAALARGHSRITNLELSQDIEATIGAVTALGAQVEFLPTPGGRLEAVIDGISRGAGQPVIDCRESGSTLRFMIPVALAEAFGAVFTGAARLGERQLGPYFGLFREHGIAFERGETGFPLAVRGKLAPGRFAVPGNVSSQFITGLLLALPLLDGDSELTILGGLESLPYVDITLDVLKKFGISAQEKERGKWYGISGGQAYQPRRFDVEGDWSQSAFLLLMGLLGGPVSVSGLNEGSKQGDRAILDIFRSMGGDIAWAGGLLTAAQSKLHSAVVDVSQCPDLTPVIAAAMAVAAGESLITGGRRLRDKESDRLRTIAACLNALGADVTEEADGLAIRGRDKLAGGEADSFNDHRIAMMAASANAACVSPVILGGFNAVTKSWPGFWRDFKGLGGVYDEQPVG